MKIRNLIAAVTATAVLSVGAPVAGALSVEKFWDRYYGAQTCTYTLSQEDVDRGFAIHQAATDNLAKVAQKEFAAHNYSADEKAFIELMAKILLEEAPGAYDQALSLREELINGMTAAEVVAFEKRMDEGLRLRMAREDVSLTREEFEDYFGGVLEVTASAIDGIYSKQQYLNLFAHFYYAKVLDGAESLWSPEMAQAFSLVEVAEGLFSIEASLACGDLYGLAPGDLSDALIRDQKTELAELEAIPADQRDDVDKATIDQLTSEIETVEKLAMSIETQEMLVPNYFVVDPEITHPTPTAEPDAAGVPDATDEGSSLGTDGIVGIIIAVFALLGGAFAALLNLIR